jgi:hypothetical protein
MDVCAIEIALRSRSKKRLNKEEKVRVGVCGQGDHTASYRKINQNK